METLAALLTIKTVVLFSLWLNWRTRVAATKAHKEIIEGIAEIKTDLSWIKGRLE